MYLVFLPIGNRNLRPSRLCHLVIYNENSRDNWCAEGFFRNRGTIIHFFIISCYYLTQYEHGSSKFERKQLPPRSIGVLIHALTRETVAAFSPRVRAMAKLLWLIVVDWNHSGLEIPASSLSTLSNGSGYLGIILHGNRSMSTVFYL